MIQRSILVVWLCALSMSHDCHAQTVQEIVERSSRAMAPPIKYRLSANGKSCTVLQQRLDDNSNAIRMEFADPVSLARIETSSASLEIYPKEKLAIDVGFMRANFRLQLEDALGWLVRSPPIAEQERLLVSEAEFEGQKCWKIIQSNLDRLSPSISTRLDQDSTPKETVAYIDKQTYHIVGMETFSKTGEKLVQTIISNIEKPGELSSDLFLPPADFAMRKPLSIVDYLSVRESLVASRVLTQLTEVTKARQAQTRTMLAATKARLAVAQRSSSQLKYYLPVFIAGMMAFAIAISIWGHRRAVESWKQISNNPAAAQIEFTKQIDAAKLSPWTRFIRAPLVLKAFVIYTICAIVVGIALPFVLPMNAFPSVLGFQLLVPLILIHTALSRLEFRRSVYAVAALLAFYGALGIFKFLTLRPITNPMLPSNMQTSIVFLNYEFVMQFVWAFLLMSPSMQKWLRAKSSDEAQVHQISMADLLYFMLVAGLALAASMALLRSIN